MVRSWDSFSPTVITSYRNGGILGSKAPTYPKIFKGKVALQIQTGNETEVSGNNDFLVRSVLPQRNDGILGPA